jgi:hypothetical protein
MDPKDELQEHAAEEQSELGGHGSTAIERA